MISSYIINSGIIKAGFRSSFITTTVWEQHPRSHHKAEGATSMQTRQVVKVGFELATDCIQFYVFDSLPTRIRH